MRGSIAIWHDALPDGANGYSSRVEVHINIWKGDRRNKVRRFDLFDIGLRFKKVRSIKTMSLSLPFSIGKDKIVDLFDIIHDRNTLSTIFNDTLYPGPLQDDEAIFSVRDDHDRIQFFVCRCSQSDIEVSNIDSAEGSETIILFKEEFCNKLRKNIGDQYLRLRFYVPFFHTNSFISEIAPADSAFLSTISTNEVVEFRLNERRNFSSAVLGRLGKNVDLINICGVHYFLIRDMTVEMIQAHTAFKKMRRLEPDIWDSYLRNEPQFDANNMIIYHWSSTTSDGSNIDNFKALATFRSYYTGSLAIYAFVIIALGAMGSAAQALLVAGLMNAALTSNLIQIDPSDGSDNSATIAALANLIILGALGYFLWAIVRRIRDRSFK